MTKTLLLLVFFSIPALEGGAQSKPALKLGIVTEKSLLDGCPPKDESCEAAWYDVKITVTRKGQRTVVNAKGICGC